MNEGAMDERRTRRTDRQPLSPERIIRTAFGIVSRDGPEALPMRRVATALAVEPMSLYHPVPSKKALLDGVAGMAIEGVGTFDDITGTWEEQVREAARRLRREMIANPRAVTLVATRPIHSEQMAVLVESALARLVELGFELDAASDVIWTVSDFVVGNVLNMIGSMGGADAVLPTLEDSQRVAETITDERFPHLVASIAAHQASRPDEHDTARFERSLDMMIAGFATRYGTRGPAATGRARTRPDR